MAHARLGIIAAAFVVLLALCPLASTPDPEGYADRLCDTPQDLTGPMRISSGSGISQYPAVVWDGAAYAVAWEDNRDGNYEIYFARVAADGTLLTPEKRVTNNSGSSVKPSLVWNGSGYGLAWEDNTPGQAEIYWASLDSDGVVTAGPNNITGQAANQWIPSLVWDGTGYGVAYMDTRWGQFEIYFLRLNASGGWAGSDLRVTTAADNDQAPSLAWTGSEYGLAWHRDTVNEVYFARINTTPAVVGSELRVTNNAGNSQWASIAWTGTEYGLAWQDDRDTNLEIYFARITAAGVKLGTDVRVTNDTASSAYPALAWSGSEYGVAWYDYRDSNNEAYFARISAGGTKVGSDLRVTYTGGATNTYHRSLAFGTVGYGLFYFDSSPTWVYFTGIGCHADTTDPTCPNGLSVTANTGLGVTLGWTQPGADRETEIAYHRVYRDGSPAGVTTETSYTDAPRPSGTPSYSVVAVNARGWEATGCDVVSVPEPEGDCGVPLIESALVSASTSTAQNLSAVWDGSAYGVAWEDQRESSGEIYFARVAPDGTVIVPATRISDLAGSTTPNTPSLAWTGSEYGVAWVDWRNGNNEIYFARISASGSKIGSDTRITTDGAESYEPSLVWTGTEFGVAWQDSRTTVSDIYFARISAAGAKLGLDVQITNNVQVQTLPSLAWAGSEYGVAWVDWRDSNYEVYFARISAAGVKVGSDVRITNDPFNSVNPSIAWSGAGYGVAWQDNRDGNYEIYFTQLTPSGSKVGSDVRITSYSGTSQSPSLAWTGAEYGVAWHDDRSGNWDIFYASLDTNGYKIGSELQLTFAGASEYSPALAAGGRGMGLFYRLDLTGDNIRFIGLGCGDPDVTAPSCPASPVESARTTTPSHTVTLAWGPSTDGESDIGHYAIYRDGSPSGVTVATTWTDSSFDPAAAYQYVITATNAAGLESGGCSSVDTSDTVPPTCPDNLLATSVSPSSVTIRWLPAQDLKSGLKQYKVYRNDVFLSNVAAGTEAYTDGTVSAGTTYNYAVRAEDFAGKFSTGCSTATVYVFTGTITLFMTKNADTINADLDWNHVGLNEYVVYRSTSPQTSSELKRVPLSETTDPVLRDGIQLWFYYIQQRE